MRMSTNIDISLVITTRERPISARACVSSFLELADDPAKVEVILSIDHCDLTSSELLNSLGEWIKYCTVISVNRRPWTTTYFNYGCQCATGKYIWQMDGDTMCLTQGWDSILKARLEEFLKLKPDGIVYAGVSDGQHSKIPNYMETKAGTCYPILSAIAIDTLNFGVPYELWHHSADTELFSIFLRVKDRMCWIREIELQELPIPEGDQLKLRYDQYCNNRWALYEEERNRYAARLNLRIDSSK